MNYLVINANENDGAEIIDIVKSRKLNERGIELMILEDFPHVSFGIVDHNTFLDEYYDDKDAYYYHLITKMIF